MKTVKLSVEGMHCEGCLSRVESALAEVDGVDTVDVTLEPGEATVETSDDGRSDALISAVEKAGYSATVQT